MTNKSILTIYDASQKWGMDPSTLRKAFAAKTRFTQDVDFWKSGKIWQVTYEAMIRVYGEPKNTQ